MGTTSKFENPKLEFWKTRKSENENPGKPENPKMRKPEKQKIRKI
jgi:hypothetical protein